MPLKMLLKGTLSRSSFSHDCPVLILIKVESSTKQLTTCSCFNAIFLHKKLNGTRIYETSQELMNDLRLKKPGYYLIPRKPLKCLKLKAKENFDSCARKFQKISCKT